MIDKELCRSRKYASLRSDRSRVLYILIYTHTDCEGRVNADPVELKADCCPHLKYTARQVAESVIDLADTGLVVLYEDDKEEAFLEFVDFDQHQSGLRKDREAPSKIPDPDEVRIDSGVTPRAYKELSLSLSLRKEVINEEKIFFEFTSRAWKNIKQEDLNLWKKAYPACNIELELLAMADWLLSNPTKKKSNYRSFISRWLKKQQDQGGSNRGGGRVRKEHQVSQVGKTPERFKKEGWNKIAEKIVDDFWKKHNKQKESLIKAKEFEKAQTLQMKLEHEISNGYKKFMEESEKDVRSA